MLVGLLVAVLPNCFVRSSNSSVSIVLGFGSSFRFVHLFAGGMKWITFTLFLLGPLRTARILM